MQVCELRAPQHIHFTGVKGTALPGELEAYTWATQAWYDEISDWDFKNGIRKAGASGATGHFTQVVWQDSEQVCQFEYLIDLISIID